MKKSISIILALLLVLSTGLSAAYAEPADSSGDDSGNKKLTEEEAAIADQVIRNFMELTAIPRPTHHEERISAFFMDWAKAQGLAPVQDEVLNVIFDVPASEGFEEYPMVGLQAHMDMVCVGSSPDFDPENDPIRAVVDYENGIMTADGTSLGADDGIGCAIIMSMVQGLAPHGPLRVILTVDEEDGLTGVQHIDPAAVADLKYLINVDSEESDSVCVSSSGGVEICITSDKEDGKAPEGDLAAVVSVSGLTGGHSGADINLGRQNAIYLLDAVLADLAAGGLPYEIASMEGGTTSTSIPTKASAVLVLRSEDMEKLTAALAEQEKLWKQRSENTDPNLSISAAKADSVPETVISSELAEKMHSLLSGIVNGVYSMSEEIEGLVESSSNLGILRLSPDGLFVRCYERSSSSEKTDEILAVFKKAVEENGLTDEYTPSGDPWPFNPDSVLLPLAEKVYLEQNGTEVKVEAVHGTLECGTFAVKIPTLDMISIGPDLKDVHSPAETLYLRSIPKTFNLLAGILNGIAEADQHTHLP